MWHFGGGERGRYGKEGVLRGSRRGIGGDRYMGMDIGCRRGVAGWISENFACWSRGQIAEGQRAKERKGDIRSLPHEMQSVLQGFSSNCAINQGRQRSLEK